MLDKVDKLRSRSFDEFRVRGISGMHSFLERIGVSTRAKQPSTEELFKTFSVSGPGKEKALLEYFRSRESVKFYTGVSEMTSTVSALTSRFPEFRQRTIDRAERICEGRFDLLGYKNLYYGGAIPEWNLDPLSGQRVPKIHWSRIDLDRWGEKADLKVIWELNRHQYFSILGQAYSFTNDQKYAEAFVSHLSSWIDSNTPKKGINWASSLEISFRAISWIWAFYFFKDSKTFTPELLIRMLRLLYLHGRHLETYLSTYSSPNTHLTGEALGLYCIGRFLPEFKVGARWKKLGYDVLMDALDFQVRRDGTYCEQSSHYHRYTTDFYSNLLILRQLENEKIEYKHWSSLKKLFEVLLFITQPNGEMPLIGDEDGGRLAFLDDLAVADVRGLLALGAVIFDRGDLKFASTDPTAELLWLCGVNGLAKFDALDALEPAETSKAFEAGGFYVMRDSWERDATSLLVDCGEHGFLNGGHAHADALGFILSIDGEPVFVDSGTYRYASAPDERTRFRSTSAHNCLTVNGESSSGVNGPWSWRSVANCELIAWRSDDVSTYFRGTHDGFERLGVEYEREVELTNDSCITVKEILQSDNRNYYQLHFILSPTFTATVAGNSVTITGHKRKEPSKFLTMVTEIDAEYVSDPIWEAQSWFVSSCYGSRVETTKLVLSLEAKGKIVICNTISKKPVSPGG